jgi:probable HAF family extracellular repeat protein
MKRNSATGILCVSVLIMATWAAAQVTYQVTDLGTLGGSASQALGLNDRGQVVGLSSVPGDAEFHMFLWRRGKMIDLGTLGGPNSVGWSINNSGEVVGVAELPQTQEARVLCQDGFVSGINVCRAAMWDGKALKDLGTFGGPDSVAFSINEHHQVTGGADTADSVHAFIWDKQTLTDLGTPRGIDSAGLAINDRGQVAVNAHISLIVNPNLGQPDFHAFLWASGEFTDLGTLGGSASFAVGMNNRAQVVGYAFLDGDQAFDAFLWEDGLMRDLGVLPGDFIAQANGINERGEVIGSSVGGQGLRPFIWKDGQMTDLNTLISPDSGWQLLGARAINNRGQIAGFGLHNGVRHAFLLTPKEDLNLETAKTGR